MFIDHVKIVVQAGNGGNGSVHFRRERFIRLGGPDGGDGGRGGSIYLQGDANLNTLERFLHQREFRAASGGNGGANRRHGAKGRDLVIRVPVGTVVRDTAHDTILADITEHGQRILVARGGRGGLGNVHFATPTHQTPRIADFGQPGETVKLQLELKLIAEVGLIGLPNAGKSTLLAAVTRAHPKIAAYPFTTLEPYLGVARVGDRAFVIADIPGLIEGAHDGVGLGHEFLRHIQRTRLLLHLIDGSGQEGRDPLEDIRVIERELEAFDPELIHRRRLLVINKSDLSETVDTIERIRAAFGDNHELFLISAATHQGVEPLLNRVAELLDQLPPTSPVVVAPARPEPAYRLTPIAPNLFRCEGALIDRLIAQTDFREREAIERLRRRLIQERIPQAAARSGMSQGEIQVGPVLWHLEEGRITWSGWEDRDAATATPS